MMFNIDTMTTKNTEENLENKTKSTRSRKSVKGTNNKVNYDFDLENDLQLERKAENIVLRFSMNANIPLMLKNKIRTIRVILSKARLSEIRRSYGKQDGIIEDFYINVSDYFDVRKKEEILKNKSLKTIDLANFSNSSISYKNQSLLGLAIEKKLPLGEIFNKNNNEINKHFSFSRDTTSNNVLQASKETVLMTHYITKKLNKKNALFVKIIELSSNKEDNITSVFDDTLKYYSINNFKLNNFNRIETKFLNIESEKNNKLFAAGRENKNRALHEIEVLNEESDTLTILKKSNLKDRFSKLKISEIKNSIGQNYNIRNSAPSIYRILDGKNKLYDVFVGDVNKQLFETKPNVHSFYLDNAIMLMINNVPRDFTHYTVYRYEESNKKNKTEIETNSSDFNFFYDNMLILRDENVNDNKMYGYQVKFNTKNNTDILTNVSNRSTFIETTGSYTLSSEIVSKDGEKSIVFTTTVPTTDSEYIYDSIKSNYPDISDDYKNNLVENYSYLSFVKLMALDLKTGNITVIGIKSAESNKIEFPMSNINLDESNHIFFGEMFSNSIISMIENMNSSSRYQDGKNDYIPQVSYDLSSLNLDVDNFISKFTSYSSMNTGTLTYSRALSDEPGNIIETYKTGVTTIVNKPQFLKNDNTLNIDKKIEINNRNVPTITINFKSNAPDSVLIVASSEKGINFRTEKGITENGTVVFYDQLAKFEFLNEIIDYFIIPVYNNYNINNVVKLGTVICSKDNFRSI